MVLCFFTSCEIGLGAQVDVEPPSVVMESPTENARTRKTVTFSGTWTDDLEIKQVTVELKKTTELTDVKESFSFIANTTNNGDDKTKGTWSYCLDTEAANIPDGAYTVIATAEDTYGHTNQVSTVITIDNTPPLIVLESPSTTEISSPMSYGKTFSIIGRGADEQNGGTVDSIDAIIYDENNVEIARKTFTNISTSIDFKIADWDEASEQGNNFYKTIYGTDENAGTKNYYVELIAYDDARKVPAEEGDRGNSTNIIYLNNTLSLIDGYKPSVAYNILNRSASSDSESALEKALKDKANQINKLTFSLNPVNNPYFEVQGYESLGTTANLEDERYSFLNKNKLTVNVYVGRDNKQIRPETVGIYLEPCDVNGNVTGSSKVTLLEPGAISSSGAITDKAVYTEEFKYSSASCTWTSKSLDVETIDGLEIGKYYKVNVSAQDYNNVNIRNSNQYALKITTVNSAPIIIINEPGASLTIAKSAAYTVKGVVKTSSKITKIRLYKNEFVEANYPQKEYVVNASETINDSGVAALKDKIVLNTSQTTVSQRYYNFSFEVDGISDSDYTLVVVAFDDNNQYAQKEISIENDVNEPTFDDSPTITPLVSINEDTGGGKYTVNGTINIAELISDDKKVGGSWWSASDTMPDATKDEGWNAGNLDGSSATNLKFSIDTTKFTDKSKKIIHLKAKDASGNIATDSSVITLDVDQSTDAPQIVLSNTECGNSDTKKDICYHEKWTSKEYETAKKSEYRTVFGTSSNNIMLGSISDDDGIKNVDVRYKSISLAGDNLSIDKEWTSIKLDTKPDGKTTYSLKAKMPQTQGTYLIEIEVKDIFYDSSKPEKCKFNKTKVGPFLIAVDDGAPKLEIKTASDGFMASQFTVEGTIDDETATIMRFDNKECTGDGIIIEHSGGKWKDKVKLSVEGGSENSITPKKYEYCYKAVDDYAQESKKIFSFNYDPVPPTFKITKVKGAEVSDEILAAETGLKTYGTADSSSYYVIEGTVSDTVNENSEGASGFNGGNIYYYIAENNGTKPVEIEGSYDISDSIKWKTGRITPTDNNGYKGNWNISINFNSELKSNGNSENPESSNSIDGKTYLIYLAAKDAAGNVSKINGNHSCCLFVTIDSEPPKVINVNIEPGKDLTKISVDITENVLLKEDNGIAVYNNGNAVKCEYILSEKKKNVSNEGSSENESLGVTETSVVGKEYDVDIAIKEIPVGKNSYTIEVIDDAGNKSVSSPILIENIAPVISSKNSGITDGAYKIEKDGKSYEYITGIITTSAVITCSGANNKLDSVSWKDEYQKAGEGNESVIVELSFGSCMPDGSGKITIEAVGDEKLADYENKYVTRTVTATNIFGQSTQWSYHFILDKTAPQINVNEIKLNDVEYSQIPNKWYKTDTLKLYGTVTEEGSGVNKIEYELKNGENDNALKGTIYASDQGNKETFESIISGFTEGSSANSMTLKVSDKAGNSSGALTTVPININIDMTVPKLIETTAPQNQNEENSESAESTEISTLWYRFVEENSKWKKYDNSILTNRTKSIELAGGFEDKNGNNRQSGVSEISVKTGEKQIFAKVYAKSEDGNWKIPDDGKTGFEKETDGSCPNGGVWIAKIDAKDLTGGDGVKSVVISIKDYAGNVGNTVSASILVDTVAPNGVIEMPGDGNVLNGKVTFSGKVNDANDVKSIQIYYAKGEYCPTNFAGFEKTPIYSIDTDSDENISMSEITSWRIKDVEVEGLLSEGESKSIVYLLPVAYDKAGNCSISGSKKLTAETTIEEKYCTKVTIDLDSDRPIVKFNNLSGSGNDCYVTSNNLSFSVEDDDGINEVKFILSDSEEKSVDWANAESVILNSGSGTIPLGGDGIKSLYLKITDTAQGEFITAFSDVHKRPYIKYSNADKNSSNDEPVKFHKDTAVPLIDNITYASGKDGGSLNEKGALVSSSIAGGVVGQCLVFKVDANDSGNSGSGIKSVQLKVNSESDNNIELKFRQESNLYETDVINLSESSVLHAGNNTLVFIVQDKAGFSSTATKQIIIDNSGPSATLITPSSEDKEAQTGIITLSGTANDEYSTVEDVRYLVLNNNYYDGEDGKGTLKSNVSDLVRTEITKEGYKCFNSGSNNTWKFTLDGHVQVDEKKNPLLPYDETTLKDYSKVPRDEKDILTMRVYIYAKDDLGNESVNGFDFKYNPFGDRPTAEVTFPTSTKDSDNKVTPANVNGAIRVTGSAQDNVSVKEVYIQLDVNNDGDFTDADKNILADCKDGETPIYQIVTSISGSDMSAIGDNFWGIRVNGTYSWNYTINKFSELLREGNNVGEEKYTVNIRAVAVDNNYKFGNWSEIQYVEFDTNIPSIGVHSKNVKEYADDGTTLLATKAYITDMYLKGKAELELSVEDKEGIEQVMYYIADTEEDLARAKGIIIKNGEAKTWGSGATETKGYIVKIPLAENSSASGTKYVKVVATKDSDTETTAYEKFSVNFDNSVPVINKITLNGVNYDDSDKKIVNSNGTYFTFGGSVTDEGNSGFDKVLFYYYREGKNGNPNRIYDPMIDSTNSSNKDEGRVNVSDLPSRVLAGQTLYGTEQSVTIESDKRTFTISEDSHIRAGGVVEINGTWLTIEKIEDTTVTLKSDAPVTGSQKVFFAYAQVIDNTGSEKTDASGNVTSASDDGDGMAESIIKSLNTWTFDATFHSNYIPDGPGKLVIFAFDKAGNVSADSYEASVQNNAPRLTRVMLATDLNGNGTYEYYSDSVDGPINNLSDKATANGTEFGEFAFYSTLNNKGEGSNIATVTLPAGRDAFIVKNNLLVVPEFTGGNGTLSYTYKIADTLDNATKTTINEEGIVLKSFTEAESSKIVKKDGSIGDFGSSKTDENSKSKEFELSYEDLYKHESWTSAGKNTKYLAATFWDSTEETTPGKDSCYALLKMPLIINVKDDTPPTASIKPFYWNSKEDSSFVYDENGNPLGHIDIPAGEGNPGVSGQVYIEGEAWDDTRLGAIVMITPKDSTGTGTEEHTVATYTSGAWQKTTGWPENWLDFEILEDLGITQAGHTVKWRMKINMTLYGIGTGKTIQVKAKDAAKTPNESTVSDTQTKTDAQTPTYKMDCVPYIKSIYTTTIGSANRSRLGKFPVRAGETMTIEGMNFAKDASYEVKFYKSGASGKIGTEQTGETITGKIDTVGQITVMAPDYSSWVEVEVNTVATKNNTNKNDGYNIEAGYVAKDNDLGAAKAASAGTNFWTDDRYISVWNVGNSLNGSINPHSGVVKKVRKEDSINSTGSVGIKGKSSLIEPKTNMTDKYVGFISSDDMRVYIYNETSQTVAMSPAADVSLFTSPVDAVDMVVLGGLPYYVIQTNYVGNVNANCWGPGLMLAREGFAYEKGTYESTTDLQEKDLQWIIERQGSSKSAMDRDSTTGYDSVLYQFKNPRIAGWHTDTPIEDDKTDYQSNQKRSQLDYVYVSYYDNYAKCLKFAAFRSGRDVDNNNRISTINTTVNNQWGGGNAGDNELVAEIRSAGGNMTTGATVVAGYDTIEKNPTNFKEKAGEWSDIVVDVTSGSPIPVIVYYNETGKCLEIAQGKTKFPKSTNYGNSNVTDVNRTGSDVWYKTKINLKGKDFGRYVSCAIDKSGNLHVAAQDATNSTLYYLYLTKDGTSYKLTKSILLDATSGSGVWTDIELTNPSGKTLSEILPVISYINSGYVGTTNGMKAAYISSGTGNNVEFDVMTDPAKWSAGNQRTSVMPDVYDSSSVKSPVAVGFNSDMYAVDFLRGED